MNKNIKNYPKTKISLEEIQKFYSINEYSLLFEKINKLIEDAEIEGIKSTGHNGKKPRLYNQYRINKKVELNEKHIDEIKYLTPELNGEYYLKHLEVYSNDREYVLMLNDFLIESREKLKNLIAVNERSFEIFGREKFILKEGGNRILSNLKMDLNKLNCYETSEPLAYYSHSKEEGQNIVIVENKDTFFTIRKHLTDGFDEILKVKIGSVIYGSGKGIYGSISDFQTCIEPYMKSEKNKILYFGDIDYEGILIYEKVRNIIGKGYEFRPFTEAYCKMIDKGIGIKLPKSKDLQNRNCGEEFFEHFNQEYIIKIKNILENGKYIPQEILQVYDF